MPADVRIDLDLDSLRSLTYQSPMTSMLYRKAQAVLGHARARAPRVTGEYASSFGIHWAQTDRNVIRVHNSAEHALVVEYGGSGRSAYRTLGNALDAAGSA